MEFGYTAKKDKQEVMIPYFNNRKLYHIANEIIGRSQDGFGYQKIEIPHVALLFHYLRRRNVLVQYTNNFVFERRRIIPYPQDIIDFSFYWDKTPQGHEFWRLIHEEWKKYLKKLSYIYERKNFRFN